MFWNVVNRLISYSWLIYYTKETNYIKEKKMTLQFLSLAMIVVGMCILANVKGKTSVWFYVGWGLILVGIPALFVTAIVYMVSHSRG